jgi:hypothetical protein
VPQPGQSTHSRGRSREDDAQQRAAEFLKQLYAAGDIDAERFDSGLTGLLAARTEAEVADVVRSLPAPIIVPRGAQIQVIRHRGGVSSRLEPPVPGLPLIRLDVTTNIGRVRLRHRARASVR